MAKVEIQVKGILDLQAKIIPVVERFIGKAADGIMAYVKFGNSPRAHMYYHRMQRKARRRKIFLRRYRRRGEKMRKHV
jgi:hypothetical protein